MQVNIKSKNVKVQPNDEALMRKKLEKLTRYLDQISDAEVILGSEKNNRGPERQVVQLTVRANGTLLRAEEGNDEILAAFDAALGKIERRIERYKGRSSRHRKGAPSAGQFTAAPLDDVSADEEIEESELRPIVRTKHFLVKPMSSEDAAEQMELLGHDFFVFFNAETKRIGVLYRRNDGDYGVLEPELA